MSCAVAVNASGAMNLVNFQYGFSKNLLKIFIFTSFLVRFWVLGKFLIPALLQKLMFVSSKFSFKCITIRQ